jgi:hypothetical protein
MANFLHELCTAALDQRLDNVVSRFAITHVYPDLHKLMVIECALKLGLNSLG